MSNPDLKKFEAEFEALVRRYRIRAAYVIVEVSAERRGMARLLVGGEQIACSIVSESLGLSPAVVLSGEPPKSAERLN